MEEGKPRNRAFKFYVLIRAKDRMPMRSGCFGKAASKGAWMWWNISGKQRRVQAINFKDD